MLVFFIFKHKTANNIQILLLNNKSNEIDILTIIKCNITYVTYILMDQKWTSVSKEAYRCLRNYNLTSI